jgi:hypothetical protein
MTKLPASRKHLSADVYGDDYFSGLTTIRFPVEAIK